MIWNIASTYSAILIPSGQSAVLGFTMPLWSALISWAVLGERLSGRLLLGVLLGGAAVLLLMVPGLRRLCAARRWASRWAWRPGWAGPSAR